MSFTQGEPGRGCYNCGRYDPKPNGLCKNGDFVKDADDHIVDCRAWSTVRKPVQVCDSGFSVPVQPDGSVEIKHSESIGATVVNTESIKRLHLNDSAEAAIQDGIPCPYPVDDPTIDCWHCNIKCRGKKAWFTQLQHPQLSHKNGPVFGGTSLKELEQKQKEELVQKCLIAKEKGYRRGYMIAELHMMCDAASQLLPDRKPQWERLRNILEDALRALWARNDQDKKESKA